MFCVPFAGLCHRSLQPVTLSTQTSNLEISFQQKQVKNIFYNVPSPLVVSNILRAMDLPYNPDLLNSVSNVENYLTQADMAINTGIFGADLCYIRIYQQYQDAAKYLAALKGLTQQLGIPEEEKRISVKRLEENIQNQDSLVNIISQIYSNSDSYLKENDRGGTAALIIFGGWVETLYLATNILDPQNPRKELVDLILQQKHSIRNMIGLLNQYPKEKRISELLPHLKELQHKFNEVRNRKKNIPSVQKTPGKTVIRNKSKYKASPEFLKEIKDLNNKLRDIMVQR